MTASKPPKPRAPIRECVECRQLGYRFGPLCNPCKEGSAPVLTGGDWVIDLKSRVVRWQRKEAS